ncbi:MAG: hypothetical protein M0R03_12565 [Novosphingobium sp.]|nr:hypothetical protein [Novosphingobium sp.]
MLGQVIRGVVAGISLFAAGAALAADPHAGHAPAGEDTGASARPTADCAAPAPLAGPLAAWTSPVAMAAGATRQAAVRGPLATGQAVRLALPRTSDVRYALRPEKPGGSVSYGGLVRFDVREAGTYRVALGSGAWIDVVARGKAVRSIAHGHGPQCSGIRKMVDFPLEPGRHILQIAANGEPEISVLIARLP